MVDWQILKPKLLQESRNLFLPTRNKKSCKTHPKRIEITQMHYNKNPTLQILHTKQQGNTQNLTHFWDTYMWNMTAKQILTSKPCPRYLNPSPGFLFTNCFKPQEQVWFISMIMPISHPKSQICFIHKLLNDRRKNHQTMNGL